MKLKKLLSFDFIQEFNGLLTTKFEKELFLASLRNYCSHGNPMRFHNFAFAMRELIAHIISRKAPERDVMSADWYTQEDESRKVTRKQQLKYCAQHGVPDKYLDDWLLEELTESISAYNREYQFFNKFTHVTEKHFHTSPQKFFEDFQHIISRSRECLSELSSLENTITDYLHEKVGEHVYELARDYTPDDLLILSQNTIVDETYPEEVLITNFDKDYVYITVLGNVHVTQEYGGKKDYCGINCSYPFELEMQARIANLDDISIISELKVDTSSWFGDGNYEEDKKMVNSVAKIISTTEDEF
ncbi:Uncharacterised protein [Serratia fonticola]|uniref:pPIWI-associating nuclease domain-containing protein n=1 Tax=Serratia fonticola TaxID=47917 RepID=UPI002177FA7D|nr:hypothetical protein [Serratia fonticola]CAI1935391.1 Uncharacterised protein [Serratia fonticola]